MARELLITETMNGLLSEREYEGKKRELFELRKQRREIHEPRLKKMVDERIELIENELKNAHRARYYQSGGTSPRRGV